MKRTAYLILIGILLLCNIGQAQTGMQKSFGSAVQEARKATSGAAQDILSNYLQVAAQNITGNNSSLQLKINWFALNNMDSASKYNNDHFLKTGWQRNGEFILSGGMDKNNKFNAFQAGLNYNLLNRRDTSMHNYSSVYLQPFTEVGNILNNAIQKFSPSIEKSLQDDLRDFFTALYHQSSHIDNIELLLQNKLPGLLQGASSSSAGLQRLKDIFNREIDQKKTSGPGPDLTNEINQFAKFQAIELLSGPLNVYIKSMGQQPLEYPHYVTKDQSRELIEFIDKQIVQNPFLHKMGATGLTDLNKKVNENYKTMVNYIGRQPLLTMGYLYTYGKGTVLSSHVTGFTYLQGTGSLQSKKTGQINASLTDTLNRTNQSSSLNRNIITLQGGYNQVLLQQKKVSIMELNLAAEINWATHGFIAATDKSRFYFDAYFRARLPSTPWLKLDLKYNPKDGNVLGFLNFTYNLDQ